jgi:hypothetical protein
MRPGKHVEKSAEHNHERTDTRSDILPDTRHTQSTER